MHIIMLETAVVGACASIMPRLPTKSCLLGRWFVRMDEGVYDRVGDQEGDESEECPSTSPAGFGHVMSFKLSGQNSLILLYRYH